MGNGIYAAVSGAIADQVRVEVLSHNIANSSTMGFKLQRTSASEVKGPAPGTELAFPVINPIVTDFSSGPVSSTGRTLDIAAIEGVFFAVDVGDGKLGYAHGGSLVRRLDGAIVNEDSLPLVDEDDTPVEIPEGVKKIEVLADGSVIADGAVVTKLKLVEFGNQKALQPLRSGSPTYLDTGGAAPVECETEQPLMPGYLEESNFNSLNAMCQLILAQRSFDASMKSVQNFQQVDRRAAREIVTRG